MKHLIVTLFISIVLVSNVVIAQEVKPTESKQLEELKKEIQQVRAELEDLKKASQIPQANQDQELERLEERLQKRLQELESKIDGLSRGFAPTAFNPRTTAFINFAARGDNKTVLDAKGETKIDNRPFLRTVELDLRAPVDPYAEAITIISLEDQAGKGFAIDAEEAYGLIKRLPIIEEAPLGLKVKVGKYRASLGVNNKLHMHDLPWITRPLVVTKYLGTEHGEFFESGYNPIGVDFDFFLPNPIGGSTLEMNLDVVRAGELGLSQESTEKQPAYLAHLNWFRDWNNEHFLTIGLSGYREGGFPDTKLYAADLTYKWRPSERGEWRSFVGGGEIFFGGQKFHDALTGAEIRSKPYGWFAYAQYQLSWWLYMGARYDWLKEPSNDQLKTKAWSAYASYYTTEFLRFRLGYEHRNSDIPEQNNINTVLFEINFVFGSHPVEPYWVSR